MLKTANALFLISIVETIKTHCIISIQFDSMTYGQSLLVFALYFLLHFKSIYETRDRAETATLLLFYLYRLRFKICHLCAYQYHLSVSVLYTITHIMTSWCNKMCISMNKTWGGCHNHRYKCIQWYYVKCWINDFQVVILQIHNLQIPMKDIIRIIVNMYIIWTKSIGIP